MSQNKFCANCGTSIEADGKFCPSCGQPIEQTITENTASQQSTHDSEVLSVNVDKEEIKKRFFSFEGRLDRQQFIVRGLIIAGISFVLLMAIEILADAFSDPYDFSTPVISTFFELIVSLPAAVANFSLQCRRWHDLDMSGWLSLISFVPLINLIALVYLIFARGTVGKNKYGNA